MSKRTLLLSIVAMTLTLGLASTPARAQDQAGQATFGNLIAALNNVNVQIENLEALNDLTIEDVTVVDASDLLQGSRIRALNNSLNRNNVEILNLRNVLNNNEVVKNALNNLDIAVNDVIAIDVLSGELTVFTL